MSQSASNQPSELNLEQLAQAVAGKVAHYMTNIVPSKDGDQAQNVQNVQEVVGDVPSSSTFVAMIAARHAAIFAAEIAQGVAARLSQELIEHISRKVLSKISDHQVSVLADSIFQEIVIQGAELSLHQGALAQLDYEEDKVTVIRSAV